MSDIGRAYRELGDLITYAQLPDPVRNRLILIRSFLPRQRPSRRAPEPSVKLTPTVKQAIRDIKLQNPALTEQEIASMVNVSDWRVNETLTGKRGKRFAIEGYQP
jgi:hypothetical protein